jgi:hypothetical protein
MILFHRIETSPVKIATSLPASVEGQADARPTNGGHAPVPAAPRGFQAVSIPTGPKSRHPQTRPPQETDSNDGPQGEEKPEEEVEEKDPEVLLEERRKKRAEIMAKFQAQGRKENPIDSVAARPAPESMGTGADSTQSGGIRTGK